MTHSANMPWLPAALGLFVAVGCGGASEGPPPILPETEGPASTGPAHASGQRSVTAQVGPDGGVLSLANGARLEIPAGALGAVQEVILSVGGQTQAFANREDVQPIGTTLIILPAVMAQPGTRFTLSAPVPALPDGFTEEDLAIATEEAAGEQRALSTNTQTRWTYGPARSQERRILADLSELTGMRLQFVVSR